MDPIAILTERQIRNIVSDEVWNCLKTFQPDFPVKPSADEDPIFTLDETADYVRVSPSLIYKNPQKWGARKLPVSGAFENQYWIRLLLKEGQTKNENHAFQRRRPWFRGKVLDVWQSKNTDFPAYRALNTRLSSITGCSHQIHEIIEVFSETAYMEGGEHEASH